MADLNNTIVRGKLRVTDEIIGPLNITNLSAGTNGQFLSVSNSVPTWTNGPSVNNATLTIQKNGSNVATFSANASTDVKANITVPTKVSELTNDSNFTTIHYLYRYDITVRGSSFNGNLDTVITFSMIFTTYYPPATWTYANLVNRLSNQGYNSDTAICAANGLKISNSYAPQGSSHILGVYANGSNLGFVYGETATNGNTLSMNSASFGNHGIPDVLVVVNGPFTV